MFTDYNKKENRLRKPSADFRLADNDDFFGYSKEEDGFTATQTIIALVIGLPVLYAIVWVLLAMTPNI